jgi:hypothetical protein
LLINVRAYVFRSIGNIDELSEFSTMLSQVRYGEGITSNKKYNGTVENLTEESGKINNILQAEKALRHILRGNTSLQELNQTKYNDINKKLGDLHIYSDGRPMIFDINMID